MRPRHARKAPALARIRRPMTRHADTDAAHGQAQYDEWPRERRRIRTPLTIHGSAAQAERRPLPADGAPQAARALTLSLKSGSRAADRSRARRSRTCGCRGRVCRCRERTCGCRVTCERRARPCQRTPVTCARLLRPIHAGRASVNAGRGCAEDQRKRPPCHRSARARRAAFRRGRGGGVVGGPPND
jgi:hypothetical protein